MNPPTCQSVPSSQTPAARIAASTRTISLATGGSRILGFIRDLVIAQWFGTGAPAQAFVVAFRLPNLLRDLVGEGAMTSSIVPVFSAMRATESPQAFWRTVQATAVKVFCVSAALAAAGMLAAPALVAAIAPGFLLDHEQYRLTVRLTQWLFPFILLVGLWAFFSGLLNSLHHFSTPALGPIVLNALMIAGCVWLVPRAQPPVMGLVWAVLAGGLVQLAIQVPAARRAGFRWAWRWQDPGSAQIMRLLAPRLLGTAVYQGSVFLNTILASLAIAGPGAVAALYFANRLVQLPLALFATASAQASLPTLSERAALNDVRTFRDTVASVLRIVLAESLPAAVGLMVLCGPIIHVCFERGAFDRTSTLVTASALAYLAVGLVGYAAGKVLTGAFYALKDTRTPVRLAGEALLVNAILAAALLPVLGVGGLALATSLSSLLNAWRLVRALERRLEQPLVSPLLPSVWRMGAASGIMGLACAAAWAAVYSRVTPVVGLGGVMIMGVVIYGLCGLWLNIEEVTTAVQWISAPLRRRSSSA